LLSRYKKGSLFQFWTSLENEYNYLSHKVIKLLMIFSNTYVCEITFLTLVLFKTKQRSRWDANAELRFSKTSMQSHLSRRLYVTGPKKIFVLFVGVKRVSDFTPCTHGMHIVIFCISNMMRKLIIRA